MAALLGLFFAINLFHDILLSDKLINHFLGQFFISMPVISLTGRQLLRAPIALPLNCIHIQYEFSSIYSIIKYLYCVFLLIIHSFNLIHVLWNYFSHTLPISLVSSLPINHPLIRPPFASCLKTATEVTQKSEPKKL